MALLKNLAKNGFASMFGQAVRISEQLILVPFFINAWGTEYYGEWLTLTIIPTVFGFSDLGFGTAAANSFVLSYASKNYQKASNVNKTAIYIITIAIFIGTVVSLVAFYVLNYWGVFEKTLISKSDAIISVAVLVMARFMKFYTQLFASYYRAARKAALGINLLSFYSLCSVVAALIVLLFGEGVIELASSQLVVILIFNIYFAIRGKSILDIFKIYKGSYEVEERKEIIAKGLSFLMTPVWQALFFQGTTLIVRVVLGANAVTVFTTARTLTRSINQLFNTVNQMVFPEIQFEIGQNNLEKVKILYRITFITELILAVIGVIALSLFGLSIYKIWTQSELHIPTLMWYILLLGILVNSIWWSSEMIFGAANRPKQYAIYGIGSSVISLIISYFGGRFFGLVGVAFGTLFLELIMAFLILPSASKIVGVSITSLFTKGFQEFQNRLLILVKEKFF